MVVTLGTMSIANSRHTCSFYPLNLSVGAAESVPYAKRPDYIAHNDDFLLLRRFVGRLRLGDRGECGRFKVATPWV